MPNELDHDALQRLKQSIIEPFTREGYEAAITEHKQRWHVLRSPLTFIEQYHDNRAISDPINAALHALRDVKTIVIDHTAVIRDPANDTEYKAYKKVQW